MGNGKLSGHRLRVRYDRSFYDGVNEGSLRSARVVVPMVVEVLGDPASVVDVGCGAGAWLAVLAESGLEDYLGLDGGYVATDQLLIPPHHFQAVDLEGDFELGRRFSLVMCLEVAEHLDPTCADGLIDRLVALGDTILFSAAIPYQGGVDHKNEQWPEYWQAKFTERGYIGLDPFRTRLWVDDRVEAWFAQNLLLYVTRDRIDGDARLEAELARTDGAVLALVHPRTYESKARAATVMMKALPRPLVTAAKRLLTVRSAHPQG